MRQFIGCIAIIVFFVFLAALPAFSAIFTENDYIVIPTFPLKEYPPTFFWIISCLVGPVVLWLTWIGNANSMTEYPPPIQSTLVFTPLMAFVSTVTGVTLWETVGHRTGLRELVISFLLLFLNAFLIRKGVKLVFLYFSN